ncbi:hypothetical protein ABYF32_00905 [Buchananella felis]|uniref:LysM peptidoglycan-binding domain-containing protein n=1 Tax=Buchananella felis TaxID=3231492 RepID=UPI0035287FB7
MRRGTNPLLGGLAAGVGLAVATALCVAGLKDGLAQMGTNNPSAAFEGAVVTALCSAGLAVSAWAALTLLLSLGTWLFPQAVGLARLLEDVGFPWLKRLGRQASLSAAAGGLGFALAVSPSLATATDSSPATEAAATVEAPQLVPALGSQQWRQAALPSLTQPPQDLTTAPQVLTAAPQDLTATPQDFTAAPAGLDWPAAAFDQAAQAPKPSTEPTSLPSQTPAALPAPHASATMPTWLESDVAVTPPATTWPAPVPPSDASERTELPTWLAQDAHDAAARPFADTPGALPTAKAQDAPSAGDEELPSLNWPAPQGPAVPVASSPQTAPATPAADPANAIQGQAPSLPAQAPGAHPNLQPAPSTPLVPIGFPGRSVVAGSPVASLSPVSAVATSPASAASATAAPGLVTPLESAARVHLVAPGESLWSISAELLPGASDAQIDEAWRAIYAFNRAQIGSDPNLILPGQHLVIPDGVLS